MFTTDDANGNPPEPPLQRLLRLTHVQYDQTISVAGPDSLDVMIALCRAGYARVECARQATCVGADETSRLLILTGPPETLGGLATRTLPLLQDGGVMAAYLRTAEDDQALRCALLVRGMDIITSALDNDGGLIVAHRIKRSERLAMAS